MRKSGLRHSLLLLLLFAVFPSGAQASGDDFDSIIQSTARAFGVEPALVKAVIAAESGFEPEAVSYVGALGLMQLMPETAAELGVADPMDPVENIEGGTRYLREMLDRYGDMRRALAAYNAGPEAVDRFDGVPPYRETRRYVSRVLGFYRAYRSGTQPAIRSAAARRRSGPDTHGIEMIRGTDRTH